MRCQNAEYAFLTAYCILWAIEFLKSQLPIFTTRYISNLNTVSLIMIDLNNGKSLFGMADKELLLPANR